MLIDINKPVALGHLSIGIAHQVDAAPRRVAPDLNTILDGLGHGLDVIAQVLDTIVVVDGSIRIDLVAAAEAVLNHHNGNLIALVHLVEHDTQTHRVDWPLPCSLLEVRILGAPEKVTARLLGRVSACALALIVAVRIEIDRTLFENLTVLVGDIERHALLVPDALGKVGVLAAHLDI